MQSGNQKAILLVGFSLYEEQLTQAFLASAADENRASKGHKELSLVLLTYGRAIRRNAPFRKGKTPKVNV